MSAIVTGAIVSGAVATLGGIVEIIKELVPDKDKQTKIIMAFESLKQQVYAIELSTQTIPWVDALHKMGRQVLALVNMMLIGALIAWTDVDWEVLVLLAGPNSVYQYIKGKGK